MLRVVSTHLVSEKMQRSAKASEIYRGIHELGTHTVKLCILAEEVMFPTQCLLRVTLGRLKWS